MKLGLALVLVVGCHVEEGLVASQQAIVDDGSNCPAWMCGQNSPLIDNFSFHDFNLSHVQNSDLITYERFMIGSAEYQLHVDGGVLTASKGGQILVGSALVNGDLWLNYDGGPEYVVRITGVGRTAFWATPPSGNQILATTYTLQWSATDHGILTGDFHDVCANPLPLDAVKGLDSHQSVMFEGDIVDAPSKTITGYDTNVVNIGCAGSTLAKMLLTGHTGAAAVYGLSTTVDERQTMLKMLSADYCGDGTPFTVAGMPLRWADDHGTMKIADPTKANLEARWNAHGATCLLKPRVVVNPTDLATKTFGDSTTFMNLLAKHCTVPQCSDVSLTPSPEHLVSANPVL